MGSPWPMKGGGPTAAKAWMTLPATATRNRTMAVRPRAPRSRTVPRASPSLMRRSRAPISTRAHQKMKADQV